MRSSRRITNLMGSSSAVMALAYLNPFVLFPKLLEIFFSTSKVSFTVVGWRSRIKSEWIYELFFKDKTYIHVGYE